MVGSRDSAAVRMLRQARDGGSGPSGRARTSRSRTLTDKTAAYGYCTGLAILPAGGVRHRKSYIDPEPAR
jgi:hypothetical protein